jgi:3-deoxy-7-phosphoheptulonate synthase
MTGAEYLAHLGALRGGVDWAHVQELAERLDCDLSMRIRALSHGNRRVMLCERGIRTYETATRNTTDINAIPVLKAHSHLPVFLDPSHRTGNWQYVAAGARAGIAAGADGLIIEVHANPDQALSDGAQSLKPERFAEMVTQVRMIAAAMGRNLAGQAMPVFPAVQPVVLDARMG